MIRGCQKRIYYVKNPESNIFDEAYFILRRNIPENTADGESVTEEDMKREAIRIVLQTEGEKEEIKKKSLDKVIAFAAGAAVSSVIIGIIAVVAVVLA